MNESVLSIPLPASKAPAEPKKKVVRRNAGAFQWYLLLALLITFGWLVRDYDLIDPKQGVGYWLGIVSTDNPLEGTVAFWQSMIAGITVASLLVFGRLYWRLRRPLPAGD